jgi:hypothetical protein
MNLEAIITALEKLVFGDEIAVVLTTTLTGAALSDREHLLRSLDSDSQRSWGFRWFDISSGFFKRLEIEELAPWPQGWEHEFSEAFHKYFSQEVGTSTERPKIGLSSKVLSDWYRIILNLTGRHPALAGGALEFLERLRDPTENSPVHLRRLIDQEYKGCARNKAAEIQTAIEDYLSRDGGQLRRLRSTIREWQSAKETSLVGQASNSLKKIASLGDLGLPKTNLIESEYSMREILRRGDLCYEDPDTGKYIVPGSLLRREILGAVISLGVEPSPDNPDEEGVLNLHERGSQVKIPFARAPWKILWFLYGRRTEETYCSLKEIEIATGLTANRAVQNGIQRIYDKLSEVRPGLAECIANRRGEGYRFISITHLESPTDLR